jgi:hypothetical protein
MQQLERYPPPPPLRIHRCGWPVTHSLGVMAALGSWLWFSITTNGLWGYKLAALLDPHKTGLGLPIAVFTNLGWLLLIPLGTIGLYLLGMWRCTGRQGTRTTLAQVLTRQETEPVIIERVTFERLYYPEGRRD